MFDLSQKDSRTDRERYLEDELASVREQQEREQERRDQDRRTRERERREEREHTMRQATDWPDALNKQRVLCQREVNGGGDEEIGNFFANTVAACETAIKIWREVLASKQGEIESIEKQISAVRESIRLEVSNKLVAADERNEFAQVAYQIRDDELSNFLDW